MVERELVLTSIHTAWHACMHMHKNIHIQAHTHIHTQCINKAFKGMTSPTSDFICLLGQDYLHFSDPLPHLPSVLLLLGGHSLPEAFTAVAGQNGSLVSDIKFSAESLLRAGVTNGFYLLLENEALSHLPAHKTLSTESCRAQPQEQGTEICPEAPSVSVCIYVAPSSCIC